MCFFCLCVFVCVCVCASVFDLSLSSIACDIRRRSTMRKVLASHDTVLSLARACKYGCHHLKNDHDHSSSCGSVNKLTEFTSDDVISLFVEAYVPN